jgi:hypothetical protein
VLIDDLAWACIALWLLIAVPWTIWLLTYRSRRPSAGKHAKAGLQDYAERQKQWKDVRQLWLVGMTMPTALVTSHRDYGVTRWSLGAALLVIAVWEVQAWFSASEPGARARNWKALGPVIVTAPALGLLLLNGTGADTYLPVLAIVAMIFILAELEPSLRSWMIRRSGGSGI